MRVSTSLLTGLLYLPIQACLAAASWSFNEASLSVQSKGAGVGGGVKEKLTPDRPLSSPIELGASDTLKLILTLTEGKKAKRPHQAFLTLTVPSSGIADSFPLSVKDNGKAKIELTHKDLPHQFLASPDPLQASLIIASFGSSQPYTAKVFNLRVPQDPNSPVSIPEKPVRYGRLNEINHIFRADPKSPPKIITLFFTAAVLAALPILLGSWGILGANVNHLSDALKKAPVSHALFFGSMLALEGIFFLYYTSWNLFQTLPAAAAVGSVAFLSGSRALTEVQDRRLAGLR